MFDLVSKPLVARKIWNGDVWDIDLGLGKREKGGMRPQKHSVTRLSNETGRRVFDTLSFCIIYLLLSLLYPALLALLYGARIDFGLPLIFGFFCLLVSPGVGVLWYFKAPPQKRLSMGWIVGISVVSVLLPWLPLIVLMPIAIVMIIPMGGPALPVALIVTWAYARFAPWRGTVVN